MTLPKVRKKDLKSLADIMRLHIKDGKACLETISRTSLSSDADTLKILEKIFSRVTPAAYMAHFLLHGAMEGRIPQVSSHVRDSIIGDFLTPKITDEEGYVKLIRKEWKRIKGNNQLYTEFINYVANQLPSNEEKSQIFQEAVIIYNAVERAIWSHSPNYLRSIKQP